MKKANVQIYLKPAPDGNLAADVVANFEMDDQSVEGTAPSDFLVAFPVTGLRSKVLTIEKFKVLVDGKEPATVCRRAIMISRREAKLEDAVISGQLEARFAPEKDSMQWATKMSNAGYFRDAFIWQQHTQPGAKPIIQVSYTATLRPQSLHYSKSIKSEEGDAEVIPYASLRMEDWNDQFFFFDYILTSGSTWFGPIEEEIIEVHPDPVLQLGVYDISEQSRPAIGCFPPKESKEDDPYASHRDQKDGSLRILVSHKKPDSDILLYIPASKISRNLSAVKAH